MAARVTAYEALDLLMEGNARFRQGEARFTGLRPDVLEELAKGQKPFATILGCSDSRVPPELIFDAVLGELFVIRVAGNIMSAEIAGSLQYAGVHLKTPLFVVLGHSGCGAIHAGLSYRSSGIRHQSRIQILVDGLLPALKNIDRNLPDATQHFSLLRLMCAGPCGKSLPPKREQRSRSELKLLGGVYDMTMGEVRFFDLVESSVSDAMPVSNPDVS